MEIVERKTLMAEANTLFLHLEKSDDLVCAAWSWRIVDKNGDCIKVARGVYAMRPDAEADAKDYIELKFGTVKYSLCEDKENENAS